MNVAFTERAARLRHTCSQEPTGCILTCALTPEQLLLLLKSLKSVNYTITTSWDNSLHTQIHYEAYFRSLAGVLLRRGTQQQRAERMAVSVCRPVLHFRPNGNICKNVGDPLTFPLPPSPDYKVRLSNTYMFKYLKNHIPIWLLN